MQSNREIILPNLNEKVARTKSYQERSVPKFLKKVFFILEENRHNDYVSWSNDGTVMIVKKPTEFAEKVLPQYFKHNNLASFVRQLNMYNFKKKKNYHYDHAYAHDMFQKGRIDLLRNIHRKAADNVPIMPTISTDIKTCKENVEINVDNLIQENLQYKIFHKTILTQVRVIENKMGDLKNEINVLNTEQYRLKMNEEFLQKVIKNISKVFGAENVKKIIEADSLNYPSLSSQATNSYEKVSKPVNQNLMMSHNQVAKGNHGREACIDDMDIIRKIQHVEEREMHHKYPAKYLNLNNFPLPYAYDAPDSPNDESYKHPQALQVTDYLNNHEDDYVYNTKSESSDAYMDCQMKFERQQLGPDAFLESGINREYRNLDIDDLFAMQSQLMSREF